MKFLVNPPRAPRGTNPGETRATKGGHKMAKRKTPPRYKSGPKKGQFKPRSARKRNPAPAKRKRAAPRRRASPRRASSSRRRNPDLVAQLMGGVVDAAEIVVGKAATRALPPMLKLPTTGNTGLAVQIATAVALGYVADMAFGADIGRNVLAGALSAPLEAVVIAADVPILSAALITPVPSTGSGTTAGYSRVAPRPRLPAVSRAPARRALPPGGMGSWITSPPGSGVEFM